MVASRTQASRAELIAPVPLAIHPSTSYLILPSSHPSSLQIYAPRSSELISELEVAPSNRVSRRDDIPIEHARVTHAVISASGEWMATVDIRNGSIDFGDEIVMKIWRWENRNWTLNSRIDRPHDKEAVASIAFSPQPLPVDGSEEEDSVLLTAGGNGLLRTWRVQKTVDGDSKPLLCVLTGTVATNVFCPRT